MNHVPFEFINKVFDTIEKCPQHTFLILTKRIRRALEFSQWWLKKHNQTTLPDNLHFGVSISTQAEADEKIPILLQIPATVRWLSIEPMLEGIDLHHIKDRIVANTQITFDSLSKKGGIAFKEGIGIDGVIVGGESGPGARPMHPDWVRSIRDQCVAAGVSFYFKQWGKWGIAEPIPNDLQKRFRVIGGSEPLSPNTIFKIFPEHANSTIPQTGWVKVGKKKAGRMLDGKEWKQLPERR